MILTRSPLRITLGGGGTDLPSYYNLYGGFVLSAAINKYVYVSLIKSFTREILLKYSKIERVKSIFEIQHPIFREALNMLNYEPQIEITTIADIPAGTGLGSSGSFTTALLKALYSGLKKHLNYKQLAELACHIEINCLREPIGKQDQYIAATGGLTSFTFQKNSDGGDDVISSPLNIKNETLLSLQDNLLLFFTGFSRSASNILKDQNNKSKENNRDMIDNLHFVKDIGYKSQKALENDNIELFGELMHQHWENKKKRSKGMSNSQIDEWYNLGLQNGAIGGKIVGAGGGGFLMFVANDKIKLRKIMTSVGLEEVDFQFEFEGTKVLTV